jgi:DNA-binding transcriptional regulator GbsR (MarR family)
MSKKNSVAQNADSARDAAFSGFIEHIGLSAENDGLPKIAGRIMGFFVLFGGPTSFSEIATRLQVSRASISNTVKLLLALGVIERVSLPGDRQDYYQLSDKPYLKLMQGHLERTSGVKKVVSATKSQLADEPEDLQRRLAEMESFYESVIWYSQGVISKMDD